MNPETGKTKKVYTTGHSLGAAAATVAASRLGTFARGCFTYGSPRVGNRKFIKTTEKDSIYNNLKLKSTREILSDIKQEDKTVA